MALPTAMTDSLAKMSRQEQVSLFMVLLAGFPVPAASLFRHEDIGIASCAANRSLTEVEGLIGRLGTTSCCAPVWRDNPRPANCSTAYERLRFVRTHTRICIWNANG